ncbi:9315_t:CDS:2 [Funneliformis geosporum]|uniref:18227_t:CDS:1 n=1 Tax=Funneliformis geosporum TaxID=1117311 RepID=A0A9W4WWY1_9GLOM|nr:18227_t:CDS:2 [Funneliformis geosporum]CAI2185428.1 9315_t:CDS:2 [Funneliformis geosporum]
MDDLNDLIWGSGSNKSQNQKNNNTSLNAMRGIPATLPKNSATQSTIKQSTTSTTSNSSIIPDNHQNFLLTPSTSGKKIYPSNYLYNSNKSPSISSSSTSNNNSVESLDDLLPFNKKPPSLSLAEKQGKGSSSRETTGDIYDILSETNPCRISESTYRVSSNNQINSQTFPHSKPTSGEIQWDLNLLSNDDKTNNVQNTVSSKIDDLMAFGIVEKQTNYLSPTSTFNVEDDENPLGELAKPISAKKDASSLNKERDLSRSPTTRNEFKDHLIAQIVDMGFSADEAEASLAATDNGEDVNSAIDILIQQREVIDKIPSNQASKSGSNKSQPYGMGRRRSNTVDYSHQGQSDDSEHGYIGNGRHPPKAHTLSVPRRNVYGVSISDGESSDRSSASVSSNFLQQKEKLIFTASEFGASALKKASAFYKQSKEVVNKALEDLQPDSEEDFSRRPRWMQENNFQSGDDFPGNKFERFEERFQDSFDESSSDDDLGHRPVPGRHRFVSVSSNAKDSSEDELPAPGQNKFIPVSSRLRDSSDDDVLTDRNKFVTASSKLRESNDDRHRPFDRSDSNKPSKPVVPSRSTKPNVDSFESAYISLARRRPLSNNLRKPVRESSSSHVVIPSKPPRSVVHASPEQLNKSEAHKANGNEQFKLGQFGEAEQLYSLAIDSLPSKHLLRVILYNNRAAAKLKNGDHRGCAEDCTLSLRLIDDYSLPPPTGVSINLKDQYTKALFRRASAYEIMEKYENARDDYQKLISGDPNIGKNVSDGLRRCQKAIKIITSGEPRIKRENHSFPKSSNKSSNHYEFNEFMLSGTSISTGLARSETQSTFGAPLNAFGFIDPMVSNDSTTSSTNVDPNIPAVAKLRDQTRQQEFEDAEKLRLKDQVDQKILQWKGGKETNIRALISSLDIVLWDGVGWKKIGLHELVTPSQVKVRYMKAIAKVHPDKLSSSTTIEEKLLANSVFSSLNDAWDIFKVQNNL